MAFETAGCDMPSSMQLRTVVRARITAQKILQLPDIHAAPSCLLQIRTGAICAKNCPYPGFPDDRAFFGNHLAAQHHNFGPATYSTIHIRAVTGSIQYGLARHLSLRMRIPNRDVGVRADGNRTLARVKSV